MKLTGPHIVTFEAYVDGPADLDDIDKACEDIALRLGADPVTSRIQLVPSEPEDIAA